MGTLVSIQENGMSKNPIISNVVSAVAVAGFGLILLNLTFLFDYALHRLVTGAIGLFAPADLERTYGLRHALFVAVIGLISWPIFRSRLGPLYKAIYMTVPSAVVFVTLGMLLYRWPIAAYSLGTLVGAGVLYCFYRTKQPWLYYYAVILVGLALAAFSLRGGEI